MALTQAAIPRLSAAVSHRAGASSSYVQRAFSSSSRHQDREPIRNSPRALLPEFSLKDKVIIVSGGAQGLGLVQTEALLEAGAAGWFRRSQTFSSY